MRSRSSKKHFEAEGMLYTCCGDTGPISTGVTENGKHASIYSSVAEADRSRSLSGTVNVRDCATIYQGGEGET